MSCGTHVGGGRVRCITETKGDVVKGFCSSEPPLSLSGSHVRGYSETARNSPSWKYRPNQQPVYQK